MQATERAMLEALKEYYEWYNGMMAGVVAQSEVDKRFDNVNEACAEHVNNNDGTFPISD